MAVTIEDVENMARLARLGLREEEKHSLRGELESILSYVEKLLELDTSGVAPTLGSGNERPVLREDRVTNPERAREMVAGAPDSDETFLRVPKILE